MIDRKVLGFSVAAITLAALLLTIGSGVALAQVVASATGSGQIHVSGEYRTFTFSAQTDSTGVTTGEPRALIVVFPLPGKAISTASTLKEM